MDVALMASAFVLGLAYCAPPGPVFAEASRRGLAHGFRPALAVEIGSLVGDAFWVALALAGARHRAALLARAPGPRCCPAPR